jgi:hypothetical protein
MRSRSFNSLLLPLFLAGGLVACANDGGTSDNGSGGSGAGTGGSGGSTGTGGSPSTGGTTGMGGAKATGGTLGAGGLTGTGGVAGKNGTGGTTAMGGTTGAGGTVGAAGTSGTGGSGGSAGGTSGTGGIGGMGAAGHGGNSGSAGTTGVGGTGGSTPGTGGTSGGGGTGTAGSGGLTSSVEDDGTDCTIGTVPSIGTQTTLLPDPFKKLDGTEMTMKSEWRCRREEIRKTAEKNALGTKPPKPMTVTGTVTSTKITVNVTDGGKSSSFSVTVSLPTSGKAPYPAIIEYTGVPLDMATINSEGVAMINYNPYDVGAEGHGHGTNQSGAFYSIYSGGSGNTGLLAAWAWGTSRIIDVIAQSDGSILDANAIAVTGCSRFGKGSFIAGVLDQRIALTMPIESGTDGVPIWRGIAKAEKGANGNPPQSMSSAYSEQPWYADASMGMDGDPTKAPLDTHELVAMVAPRGLFIMENPWIGELASKYGHVAALGGLEVYKALGYGDNLTYYSDIPTTEGGHCSARPEWVTPLKNNIERFLKKTGTAPGVIKASSMQTGDLSTWRSWTTPTLN